LIISNYLPLKTYPYIIGRGIFYFGATKDPRFVLKCSHTSGFSRIINFDLEDLTAGQLDHETTKTFDATVFVFSYLLDLLALPSCSNQQRLRNTRNNIDAQFGGGTPY